jgi:hypothetical protein
MLTDELKEELSKKTIEELTELKTEVASLLKEKKEGEKDRKAQEKLDRATFAQDNLEVGNVVTFTYKGEVLEGEVRKLNDKSFTVAFEYEGEDKVLARLYHLFVDIVSEQEDVA